MIGGWVLPSEPSEPPAWPWFDSILPIPASVVQCSWQVGFCWFRTSSAYPYASIATGGIASRLASGAAQPASPSAGRPPSGGPAVAVGAVASSGTVGPTLGASPAG